MIDIKLNNNWLQQRANLNPNDIAVLTFDEKISYTQLADKVNNCTNFLIQKNITQDDRVGLLFSNSVEFIFVLFSLWRIGAVPVPFNLRLSKAEIDQQIVFSKIKLLIVEESLTADYDEIEFHHKIYFSPPFEDTSDQTKPRDNFNDQSTSLILFTSGSTDKPKAVELTFGNLFYSAQGVDDEINFIKNDIFIASLPFYHVGGFSIIVRTLLSGGTLALSKSLKVDELIPGMKSYKPSIISLVPTQLKRIVDANEKPHADLRCVFLGGGAIDKNIILGALKLGWKLFIVYGSTETSSMVTMLKPDEIEERLNCAGKTISGTKIFIKDEKGIILRAEKEGRVHILSRSVMKGYLNFEERDPKEHEFISDDMGYIDHEGYLYITGRYDDIIISGGENINCRQVDKALQSHPNIIDSYSFGVDDSEWGQLLCSAIILQSEKDYSEKELKKFLRSKQADYKIPKKIFTVDNIPKSDLGKVQKNKLLDYLNINFD